jgi:hypothetical protein
MASILKHLRSSTANKRPTASGLADGQIAINTASGTPALFFKDSASNIVKVGPAHVGATAPNTSPAGSAGNSTGELWVDNGLTTNGLKYYNGTAFVNLTPSGTTGTIGLVELATDAETQAGTDAARAVTPSGLQSKISDSTSTSSSTTIASSTAVKSAYDLADAALPKTGGTITGAVTISPSGSLVFEGATDDGFETTIAVVDPTADRTITLPNVTGTVVTTGDSGTVTGTMIANDTIVDADINSAAAITLTKLGTGALPTTITVASGNIVDGTISNVEISASAAIADTKLDTISTADKVSLSALNIDGGTDIGAALADADLFIVDDGGAGTNRKAAATRITDYTFGKVSGDITITSSGVAAIGSGKITSTMILDGTILNADVNASAAIAGTKISPDFGSQTIATTGIVSHALGTAGAPTVTFTGDANTGIYSPGADQVAISTNGTGRLFVDASGNVGVGATPSSYKLDVFGAARLNSSLDASLYLEEPSANSVRIKAGTSASFIGTTSNHPFYFVTNNTERMRLTSAGLLGLGTSSPGGLLHVDQATAGSNVLRLTGNYSTSGTSPLIVFERSGGAVAGHLRYNDAFNAMQIGTTSAHRFDLYTNSSTALTIDSSQRVGIGTTSPQARLELAQSTDNTDGPKLRIANNANTLSSGQLIGGIDFFDGDDSGEGVGAYIYSYTTDSIGRASGQDLRFGAGESERARIDSSGRLLVGTSSARSNWFNTSYTPQLQLEGISGAGSTISICANTNDNGGSYLVFGKTRGTTVGANTVVASDDSLGQVVFQGSDGTELVTAATITGAVDGTPGANDMPGRLVFSTTPDGASSPTEKMRINSTGQLLVGTTSDSASVAGVHIYKQDGVLGRVNLVKTFSGLADSIANYHNGSYVGGLTYSNTATALVTSSDARLKANIQDSVSAIDIVEQVRVVSHDWVNDDSSVRFGFVAQELNTVLPEAVRVGDDGEEVQQTWGVDYARLVPVLTKALQEALGKIETLEAKVAAFEGA